MPKNPKTVEVLEDGKIIATYVGTWKAAYPYGVTPTTIARACRTDGKIVQYPDLIFRYGKTVKVR